VLAAGVRQRSWPQRAYRLRSLTPTPEQRARDAAAAPPRGNPARRSRWENALIVDDKALKEDYLRPDVASHMGAARPRPLARHPPLSCTYSSPHHGLPHARPATAAELCFVR
jgi:hypothetical protein